MKRMTLLFLLPLVALVSSCGKDGPSSPATPAPANLTVNAVVNPDNSGNVSFTASATNATTYEFDFGNGVYQT
ncbi:MAG: beta-glucanase precursor, partial [Chitinophagaceae bacterium]